MSVSKNSLKLMGEWRYHTHKSSCTSLSLSRDSLLIEPVKSKVSVLRLYWSGWYKLACSLYSQMHSSISPFQLLWGTQLTNLPPEESYDSQEHTSPSSFSLVVAYCVVLFLLYPLMTFLHFPSVDPLESCVLFFSNGWGKDSGVALGRMMRSGTTDLSGAFLSVALGGSLA